MVSFRVMDGFSFILYVKFDSERIMYVHYLNYRGAMEVVPIWQETVIYHHQRCTDQDVV